MINMATKHDVTDLDQGLRAAIPVAGFCEGAHFHQLPASGTPKVTAEAMFMHGDSVFANKLLQHRLAMETQAEHLPIIEIPCYG